VLPQIAYLVGGTPQLSNKCLSNSQRKQQERATRISALPSQYLGSLTKLDRDILDKPVEELVGDVKKDIFKPIDILRAYGNVAIKAHRLTNCLTEVMIPEAEEWANEANVKGKPPLTALIEED
jgi:hypothetical protein